MTIVPRVICVGGAAVDRKYRAQAPVRLGTSNPVTSERTPGGVARNVAENLAHLGAGVSLVSIVGADENGRFLLSGLEAAGIETRHIQIAQNHATAEYVAILQPAGELAAGLADMGIFDALQPEAVLAALAEEGAVDWLFADCNLSPECLHALIHHARQTSVSLAIDAVSSPKITRLPEDLAGISLLFLNADEAVALLHPLGCPQTDPPQVLASHLLARGVERVVLTQGPDAFVVADSTGALALRPVEATIIDATGAGDALIAATLRGLAGGLDLPQAARLGSIAAALTIESPFSVRPDLSLALLEARSPIPRWPIPETTAP